MQVKCGIDIIEIARIKDSICNLGESFILRLFTDNEIKYCESKGNNKYQHYAARFAIKEALFKALSEEIQDKFSISWTDIETINDKNGKPHINTKINIEKEIDSIDVSISHCKEYAIASCVVLFK